MFWGAFVIGIAVGACAVAVGWCCFRDVEELRCDRLRRHYDEQTERHLRMQRELCDLQQRVLERTLAEFPEWRRGPGGEA